MTQTQATKKFTKKQLLDYRDYEEVRQSGVTNMFAIGVVCSLSGLTRDEVKFVMNNYSELKQALAKAGEL